jgi:CHASE3 domain sensor protein
LPLAARVLVATAVLALVVVGIFVVLAEAIFGLRDATRREGRVNDVTVATLSLEKLVLDLETGLRGYVLTGQNGFLKPYYDARGELGGSQGKFLRLARADPVQRQRARTIVDQIDVYVSLYADPLLDIARENRKVARSSVAVAEGKRYTDQIRMRFDSFLEAEDARAASSAAAANHRSDRAIGLALAGLVACALLIFAFGAYLARWIGRPIREAAAGASHVAGLSRRGTTALPRDHRFAGPAAR